MSPKKNSFNPEEIKKSNRIFKSATPKYTTDWYIKWVASRYSYCLQCRFVVSVGMKPMTCICQ